jgi:ABC-2 type transport system permease protein
MSSMSFALRDSATMLRRDLRHAVRFPMLTMSGILVSVIFLLLFAGVFGRALHAGIAAAAGAGSYIDYLTPGILVMTAGFSAESTALQVSSDFRLGIIDRFRTMAIFRAAVLIGQVCGSMIRTMISAVLVVAVAVGLGFRSAASPAAWIAAAAVFAMLAFALIWLTVAFGLQAKTPAGANGLSLLVAILPFVSSAFVPTAAMPAGVRWFAQNEPFTPVIGTLRGLLTGGPIGHNAILAVLWCAALALAGYLWALALYNRGPGGSPALAQ